MSGSRELALHFQDVLSPLQMVGVRRFFGGWALTCHGRQFAIVMDTLYLRTDDDLRKTLSSRGSTPFSYRSGNRRVLVERYYTAPEEALERPEELCRLARRAITAR